MACSTRRYGSLHPCSVHLAPGTETGGSVQTILTCNNNRKVNVKDRDTIHDRRSKSFLDGFKLSLPPLCLQCLDFIGKILTCFGRQNYLFAGILKIDLFGLKKENISTKCFIFRTLLKRPRHSFLPMKHLY